MQPSENERVFHGGAGPGWSRDGRESKGLIASRVLTEPEAGLVEDYGEVVACFLPDGTFTYANEVFCRLFEKSREELIGNRWMPLAFPEDLAMIEASLKSLSPGNPVVMVENRILAVEGQVRWMQFVNRGFFDEAGHLVSLRSVGRDVTQRVEAEQALRESNERWKFAIEGAGDGVWDWDVRTARASFSPRWKAMLGYEEDEIAESFDEWETRVHPDDMPAAKAELKGHFDGGKDAYKAEFRMRCKDGAWKWILARGKVITRDGAGKPLRVIGTHTDISAWKAAKEREAQNLKLVAEGAPCAGVLEALVRSVEAEHPDMLCSVMLVNEVGRTLRTGAAPSLPEAYHRALNGMSIGPEVACSGAAVYHKRREVAEDIAKDRRWTRYRDEALGAGLRTCWSEPILSRSGEALGAFACYHRQVHQPKWSEIGTVMHGASLAAVAIERDQAEQALRESEQRFRAIFEQAAVGVALIDTGTGGFLDVNQRMCEINGLSREGLRATTFMALTHPDDLQEDLNQMERLKAGEITSFNMEKRIVRPNGEVRWINLTVSPMWRAGEAPLRHMSVVEDITGRKHAETNYRRELDYNEALVKHTSAYIVAMDTRGCFIHVNPAFLQGLGYREEDVLMRTPWEIGLMDAKEEKRSKERFRKLLQGEDNPPVEVRLRAKNGDWRAVELQSTSTRRPDGGADRIIITGTDLTERNRLQQEVLNIVEREQARLGHDLHDGVGQTMTGIVSLIEALESELQGPAKEDAARIRTLIHEAVSEVRRMSHGLSPTSVKYRGLGGALQLLAETVTLNHRTPCECDVDATIVIPDPETQAHLFRIAQEAVNNALRHGHPDHVTIRLRRAGGGDCVLSVEDDGVGLWKSKLRDRGRGKVAASSGIGRRVMEYRANLIGANLSVRSRSGGGVAVICQFQPGGLK